MSDSTKVAAELGLSYTTLLGMVKRGQLPSPARVGRSLVWTAADIAEARRRLAGGVEQSAELSEVSV